MPSINIYERDLTNPSSVDTTANVVYIPGYANIGPINTPTLCNTLAEFYSIFGEKPYKFRTVQQQPLFVKDSKTYNFQGNASTTKSFYEAGDYEKSYIIATELLSKSLPVLFERITPTTPSVAEITVATNTKISAKNVGLAGCLTYVEIKAISGKSDMYELTVIFASSSDQGRIIYNNTEMTRAELAKQLGLSQVTEKFEFTTNLSTNPTSQTIANIKSNLISIEGTSVAEVNAYLSKDVFIGNSITNKITVKSNDEFSVNDIYKFFLDGPQIIGSRLNDLTDKGSYQIKFLTSGAYPLFEFGSSVTSFECFENIIETAGIRGDCVALVDYNDTQNTRTLDNTKSASVYKSLETYTKTSKTITRTGGDSEDAYTYAAMFMPYATYKMSTMNNSQYIMPASFAYLSSLAVSTQTNPNWLAIAGVSRGIPSGLVGLSQNVTNAIADLYQPRNAVAINCITNIKPYGYTIWGNRTLKDNSVSGDLKALSFLNIRVLTSDLKKVLYQTCKRYTFENNTDIMWLNFKSQIEPTLAKMLSGNGIASYQIIKVATTKKATVEAIVRLVPIEPVEDWYITVELTDGVEANIQ